MRALLALLASFVLFASASLSSAASPAEKRVALVIGNARYQHTAPLTNPANDAEDLSKTLKRLDFEVVEGRDLSKRGMAETLARFARIAQDADAALVFYAGHGLQHRGENYLVPVDAKLVDEISVDFETTRLDDVVRALDRARGVRILILDACRNLVLPDGKSTLDVFSSRGLAKIGRRGMIVAYATQADDVAYDGTGRNSFFTGALLRTIEEPGLEISQLFRKIAATVSEQTKGKQTPELSLSWTGEFFFNRGETDRDVWLRLRNNPDRSALQDFVSRFPKSDFVDAARAQLEIFNYRDQAEAYRREAEEAARRRADTEKQQRLAREELAARQKAEQERVAQAREEEQRRKTIEELAARQKAEQERLAWERLELEQRRRADQQHRMSEEAAATRRAEQEEQERLGWARLEAEQRRRREEAELKREQQQRLALERVENEGRAARTRPQEAVLAENQAPDGEAASPDAVKETASQPVSREPASVKGAALSAAELRTPPGQAGPNTQPVVPASPTLPHLADASSARNASAPHDDKTPYQIASSPRTGTIASDPSESVETGSIAVDKAVGTQGPATPSSSSEIGDTKKTVVASLDLEPALPKVSGQALSDASNRELARAAQESLRELGCYPGEFEAGWGLRSKAALRNFYRHAGLAPPGGSAGSGIASEVPDSATLEVLRSRDGRICPLVCPRGRLARGDVCMVKTCPDGYALDDDECVPRKTTPRDAPNRHRLTRQREPQQDVDGPRPRLKPRIDLVQPTPSLRRTKAATVQAPAPSPSAAPPSAPNFGPAHIGATRLMNRF